MFVVDCMCADMAESAHNMYMEGNLLKRQRGLHKTSLRGLRFQERFCCLNTMSLEYFEILPKKKVLATAVLRFSHLSMTNIPMLHSVVRYLKDSFHWKGSRLLKWFHQGHFTKTTAFRSGNKANTAHRHNRCTLSFFV